MRFGFSDGWCEQMANREGDTEIGAGTLAIDPWFSDDDLDRGRLEMTESRDPIKAREKRK